MEENQPLLEPRGQSSGRTLIPPTFVNRPTEVIQQSCLQRMRHTVPPWQSPIGLCLLAGVIVLVGMGVMAGGAHQNLERIQNSSESMGDVFEQGRCRIEAVQHSTYWYTQCNNFKPRKTCDCMDECWDIYQYQFSLLHSLQNVPATSAATSNSSLLTSGKQQHLRFRGCDMTKSWYFDDPRYSRREIERCPELAPDVVPSNYTKGQETDCWIPKKLPVDESVWGPCSIHGCVHLFSPQPRHLSLDDCNCPTSGGSYHGATTGYMSPYGPPKDEADFNCSLCEATGGYYWSLIIMAIALVPCVAFVCFWVYSFSVSKTSQCCAESSVSDPKWWSCAESSKFHPKWWVTGLELGDWSREIWF